jgi:exopolysaccharide biosynthesis polyprenyl glycosylphosphotransferase
MIRHRTTAYKLVLFLGDIGATTIAFLLAYFLRGAIPQLADRELFAFSWYTELSLIIFPVLGLSFFFMRLYDFWRGIGFWKEWWKVFQALLISFLILGFFIFFGKYQFVSRIFLFLFLIFSALFIPLLRLLIRRSILSLNRQNGSHRIYMIVGTGENALNISRKIERHGDIGLKIIGFLSLNEEVPSRNLDGYQILGGPQDLAALLESWIVDEVIFAISQEELKDMGDLFLLCEERGITVRVVLDFFPHNIARTHLEELDGIPLLTFSTTPKNEFILMFRRTLDFIGSLILILGLLPVFLLIIFMIRLDSHGPALYKQIRCGMNGRKFWFYKFRSMVEGAENMKENLASHNIMNGPVFKMENDPRITPVGRFLRKTSLDELPQLFNVLRGDMSFVGPRPLPQEEVAQFKGWQRRRLSMKPGITGLWQVSGRNLIDFNEWMKLDLEYIDNWSLWLDFKILLRTIPAIFMGKGAM